jgi:cell division septal protein FtsQ
MKKQLVIAFILFTLLTTITFKEKIIISQLNIKEIIVENNSLVKKKDVKKLLISIYNKNIIFLDNKEIEKALTQNSFIETFDVKKKYPQTLKIRIFEKKPIAILLNKKKKFYLSDKIELIEFENIKKYQDLPYVFGNRDDFKIFYNDLKKINFPFDLISKYTLYESKRWDLETKDKIVIKLHSKNYLKNIKNYLDSRNKQNFKKYKIFDYRIDNQLILK